MYYLVSTLQFFNETEIFFHIMSHDSYYYSGIFYSFVPDQALEKDLLPL